MTGQLECGFVEMHYPHNQYIMRSNNAWFATVAKAGDNYDTDKYNIEAGYYDSPERVIPVINKTLTEASGENKVTHSYRYT